MYIYSKSELVDTIFMKVIAVSVAFSPRLEGLLAESFAISTALGSRLNIVHVGEQTELKTKRLKAAMEKLGIADATVFWREGNKVDQLLQLCEQQAVELLVLGAYKRESLFQFFVSSFSRSLCRRANTSLLLVTDPGVRTQQFKNVVICANEHPKTQQTLSKAFYLGEKLGFKDVTIATEVENHALAMTMAESIPANEAQKIKKDITHEQALRIHTFANNSRSLYPAMQIHEKILYGKPGYEIVNFSRKKKADLLVLNSADRRLNFIDRLFPHGLEYILSDLPSNVLIVHST